MKTRKTSSKLVSPIFAFSRPLPASASIPRCGPSGGFRRRLAPDWIAARSLFVHKEDFINADAAFIAGNLANGAAHGNIHAISESSCPR